ncbi:MAG: hypothetical protein ACLGGX_06615 [Bdellovibrionia bacterium]
MEFFISCPIGFEEELLRELKEVWPRLLGRDARPNIESLPEIKIVKGGVELVCDPTLGIQLQFFLKTANRVLVRLSRFRCRDFPSLFQKVVNLKWLEYVSAPPQDLKIEASASRLNNEKRIAQVFSEALAKVKWSQSSSQYSLYVRVHDDQVVISLDLSGEHLHKRGWGVYKGEAPIRETIAAFALRRLCYWQEQKKLQNLAFWDPFCGSGTMVFEAAMLNVGPMKRHFHHLAFKKTPKLFATEKWALNYKQSVKPSFSHFFGSDISSEVLKLAHQNLEILKAQYPEIKVPVAFAEQGFASAQFPQRELQYALLMNPPYGERIEGDQVKFVKSLSDFLERNSQVHIWGLLAPSAFHPTKVKSFRCLERKSLKNGGLAIELSIWARD